MITVCIPALNEAETIGDICETIKNELMDSPNPLVSDLLVIDGGSVDGTPDIAKTKGARVIGPPKKSGKGAALYESILAVQQLPQQPEVVVWCDADLTSFSADLIAKLATPLLENPALTLVKGFYEKRSLGNMDLGGGRTSWLMARPLLSLFFPELAHIREPLSGEYAIRLKVAECVPFITHYGVEVGLLIDVSKLFGANSICEVNLGNRSHKNKSLQDLSVQASEILHTVLHKAEVDFRDEWSREFVRPDFESLEIVTEELPAIVSVDNPS